MTHSVLGFVNVDEGAGILNAQRYFFANLFLHYLRDSCYKVYVLFFFRIKRFVICQNYFQSMLFSIIFCRYE